jgi:hypothetical protein
MAKYNLILIKLRFCKTGDLLSLFIEIIERYHHTIVLRSYENKITEHPWN